MYGQIARDAQLRANTAESETQAQHRKVADLSNEENLGGKQKKRKKISRREDKAIEKMKIMGQKFTVTCSLWLRDGGKKAFDTALDEEYNTLNRFKNSTSKVQGEIHDILEVLPAKYHKDFLEKNWIDRPVSSKHLNAYLVAHIHWIPSSKME